ncbi:MAG TPA: xanthine permease [Firmicutes bacterium]|nr:xanthine permease [Candidatus Fermentithermobacillaceae bacterium]
MLVFALQQVIVMFPATVLVAILTGFDVGVTIVASGLATLGFLLITGRRIPLYYGSSFSYIAAVGGVSAIVAAETGNPVAGIQAAQTGIIASGLLSVAAGLLIKKGGPNIVKKVLPPSVTGAVAIIIGLSLASAAMSDASNNWPIAIVTLIATILFSVYLRGTLGQLSVLFGVAAGYLFALALGQVDFTPVVTAKLFAVPRFTLPAFNKYGLMAIGAIAPVAIATIPESTAHLLQIDLYVNNLAKRLGRKKEYKIAGLLGDNLIGDGIGDIIAGAIGGPAGTNYGENNSLMAITRNFSVPVLITAALIAIVMGFFGHVAGIVNTIPRAVIGGVSIYLFGVIGAQGAALMISEKLDLFSAKNLAVVATILIIGLGGAAMPNGMIVIGNLELPAIATAAIFGIVLNLVFELFPAKQDTSGNE